MKILRILAILFLLFAGIGVGGYFYLEQQFRIPDSSGVSPVVIEIPRGAGTRDVVRQLLGRNIIKSEFVALAYLAVSGERRKLQAGEYLFDKPMTVGEVLEKIANGRIYLHKFTVPEGLTVRETAMKWE